MAEGGQDKRHAPTERRLRQAAEKGDIGRSADLSKAAGLVVVVLIGLGSAAAAGGHIATLATLWLATAGTAGPADAMDWVQGVMSLIGPLLVLIAVLTGAASFLSGGFVFSLHPLKPDFSKFLPSHGLGQLFSRSGFTETLKSIAKFALVGGIGAVALLARRRDFMALAGLAAPQPGIVIALCLQILVAVSAGVVALAVADAGLQIWLHRHKLRMSDAEMREEMKDAVGNPQVRQRQRAIARQMARGRQMKRLPEASVIVTNPTHFAVAIRYRRGADRAPLLLAKGVGLLAQEIITRGRALGIPVVEAPPLARAVYRHVEPGEPVPVALYRATAEILAYVWRMQHWRATGGARPQPPRAQNLAISPEMEGKPKRFF